jgi:type II secretory pathway pseudopilin PulG
MNGCSGKWPGGKNNGRSNTMKHFCLRFFQSARHRRPWSRVSSQQGATYLLMMFIIVILGITLMAVSQHWSVIMKRDREAELLFRGNRIKEAIERYVADYEVQKATRANRYPMKLEDLTKRPKRYLQAPYKDPITGKDFDLILVGKDIHGVRSTSTDSPMDLVTFKGATSYNSIRFEAVAAGCGSNPANPAVPANCQQTPTSGEGQTVPQEGEPGSQEQELPEGGES